MPLTKKEKKRLYDIEYRKKNQDRLRKEKAVYFQRTYDPIKAAQERKLKMPQHIEYCRQPKYKKWKHQYDLIYRHKRQYKEFWEAALILRELERLVRKLEPDPYKRRVARGYYERVNAIKRELRYK